MCNPASFVVFEDRVLWSRVGDSHEQIRQENGIAVRQDGVLDWEREGIPCEIVPPDRDYTLPLDKWQFMWDEGVNPAKLPAWAFDAEVRCRTCLDSWAASHVVREGEHECGDGRTLVLLGTARLVGQTGGRVWLYGNAQSHGQTGGVACLYGQAQSHGQADGEVWLFEQAQSHGQAGGRAWRGGMVLRG